MDNTDVPIIDLNIDPNMIAAQDAPPQTTPSTPYVSPVSHLGTIDITPGSTDTFPADTPVSNHIDMVPLSEPKAQDITPEPTKEPITEPTTITDTPPVIPATARPVYPDKSVGDSSVGEPEPARPAGGSIQITPDSLPPIVPFSVPVAPNPVPEAPVFQAPAPATATSPLTEDPDLVKLIK